MRLGNTLRSAGLSLMLAMAIGAQAPAGPKLTPLTLDAYNIMLSSHRGHVVLVNFWATYCIPCRTEIPEMVKLAAQLKARGLDFALISADEPEQAASAQKFIAGKASPPLYIKSTADNDKFAAAIHAKWDGELPASFVYDRTGRKIGAFLGEVPMKDLQSFLDKNL